jgi:N-methylhydantoinase A/oxoprolinase/acetone carboxylase beta subunit
LNTTGSRTRYRFAFDIGGTFTDLVLSGSDGTMYTAKRLSNQQDVALPIISGLEDLLRQAKATPAQVHETVAGATTAVTNLVIERAGSPTGLITTRGFGDVIEIGRELRYDVYDLHAIFPEPPVGRRCRAEIDERVDSAGHVVVSPDESGIERAVRQLLEQGVEAIAVCLLHSYANPTHERLVAAAIRRLAPRTAISLSCEVIPEIREYERTIATVLNAYAMPKVSHYLAEIEGALKQFGVRAVLQIMQSNGGVISRELGERMPIRLLESGPAAGVLGTKFAAARANLNEVMAFDMGGTTAKACLITQGEPEITTEFEAARVHRFKKGSGWPVRLPVIDLIEIGAGGGSIAHVDATGLLKVGPRSAGSNPGPACYGRGGTQPTVTDAALVLGYLDPDGDLSGTVKLRLDLAEAAIRQHVAQPLGMTVVDAADGIHRIVCERMASSAKIHAIEKGRDIRRYTMLAFGGAGPLHAREVALRAGCSRIMVPANAGVFSAYGLLVAPVKVDAVRSHYSRLSRLDGSAIQRLYAEMADRLTGELQGAGVRADQIEFKRSADMRYLGQGFEVSTPLLADIDLDDQQRVAEAFHRAYEIKFGHRIPNQHIEVLNWRLEARCVSDWNLATKQAASAEPPAGTRRRRVFHPEVHGFLETVVVSEANVPSSCTQGPALIEQPGSTIVIGPTDTYNRDEMGNIVVQLATAPDTKGLNP